MNTNIENKMWEYSSITNVLKLSLQNIKDPTFSSTGKMIFFETKIEKINDHKMVWGDGKSQLIFYKE